MKKSPDFFITTPRKTRLRRACAMKKSPLSVGFFITPRLMDTRGFAQEVAVTHKV
jgi:hypothetical protein